MKKLFGVPFVESEAMPDGCMAAAPKNGKPVLSFDHDPTCEEIRRALNAIAEAQEPLGEPFESILRENLWNMYIRS